MQNVLAVLGSVIIKGTFMQYKFLVLRVIYANSWINKPDKKMCFPVSLIYGPMLRFFHAMP